MLRWKSLKQNSRKLIGNDVVDLHAAARESNWKRKGYLHKILSKEEQLLVLESNEPNTMVWLLWSMKESAYKIHSRTTGIRTYAPAKILCKNLDFSSMPFTGKVTIDHSIYYTESTVDAHRIHSICSSHKEELKQIKVAISIHPNGEYFDYKLSHPQSVSHHGTYLALVYL